VEIKYLLPCRCGKQHVVEPRQAGGDIQCSCGVSLPIPTLLEITALEPAPEEPNLPARSAWGWRQRLAFLGLVIVLAAIGGGVGLYFKRPIPDADRVDPEKIAQIAQQFTPLKSWAIWEAMKKDGLGRSDPQYATAVLNFQIWLCTTIALAVIGIALVAVGISPVKKGNSPLPRE
jgi:hypothetical protein